MTEQFGTAVKAENGVIHHVEVAPSYEAAKEIAEQTNALAPGDRAGSPRIVVRIQEVGARGARKIEARTREQAEWEAAHPRGYTFRGEPCTCDCHVQRGIMHFTACCRVG